MKNVEKRRLYAIDLIASQAAGLEAGKGGEDGERDQLDDGLEGSATSLPGKGFFESRKRRI